MAHGRTGPDIVMTIQYAAASDIRAVSDHELNRTPDGSSAIDPARSHLNRVLVGPRTQQQALDALWAAGVRPPTAQAEAPYVQIVLSASPSYFRAPEQGPGQFDGEKTAAWEQATLDWLRQEYGEDLVHASMHLDEDTPHMHVLVVPTYKKAGRRPGRRKRHETEDDFEERKEAAASTTIRTVGRSSNAYWSQPFARRSARQSYHQAMQPLGLGYGRDFVEEGAPSPRRKLTGTWVKEQAAELAAEAARLEVERAAFDQERLAFDKQRAQFDEERAQFEKEREALASERADVQNLIGSLGALLESVEAALHSVLQIAPRVRRLIQDVELSAQERREARAARSDIVQAVPVMRSSHLFLSGARAKARSMFEQPGEETRPDMDSLDDFSGPC